MPTATIYFTEEEDKKITKLSIKWGLAKYMVIRRIIRDFEEEDGRA